MSYGVNDFQSSMMIHIDRKSKAKEELKKWVGLNFRKIGDTEYREKQKEGIRDGYHGTRPPGWRNHVHPIVGRCLDDEFCGITFTGGNVPGRHLVDRMAGFLHCFYMVLFTCTVLP